MPILNSHGIALWGRNRAWLDDAGGIVEQQCDATACRIVSGPQAGPWTSVADRGCSAIAGGQGHWLAHLVGYGVFGPGGLLGSAMALGADYNLARGLAAPDGTIAVILDYQHARGLRLVAADGTFVDYPDVYPKVTQIAVLDRTRALFVDWRTNQIMTVGGLPVPQTVPGPVNWPTVLDIAGESWILYHAAANIVLHPFTDCSRGYLFPAGFYPHARVLPDGRVQVAWAFAADDATGNSRLIDVTQDPRVSLVTLSPPDPIVAIGRPLWCGWFCFGAPTSPLPANCQIPVVQGVPWLPVMAGGRTIAHYVAAELDGTIEGLERAIAATPAPTLAYWPKRLQSGRVPQPGYVGIEAYRLKSETLVAFEGRVRTAVARTVGCWLICQGYTQREPSPQTTELASLVPVYARIARGCPQVQGLAVFSAGSREGGWDAHPEIHAPWAELFAGIPSAPFTPEPVPAPAPVPPPKPKPIPPPAPPAPEDHMLPPIGDNEIIELSQRWIQRYQVVGRYDAQTPAENIRDEAYWIVIYARAREAGKDHEHAMQAMENGMADEAGQPHPFL